jgi:quercetin dioxygenase-like cupin family protein
MTRFLLVLACVATCASGQDPFRVAGEHYHLVFENDWARVARVTYGPHETAPVHDHALTPTAIYIYVTDGGEFRFKHMTGLKVAGTTITRPGVKAGAIRFAHSARETHSVEYLGEVPTEYVRIELRTEVRDLLIRNIRIPPPVMDPAKSALLSEFENGQVRILRVVCAAGERCPASKNPDDPAIVTVMTGPDRGAVRWLPKAEKGPLDEVRIELKTDPVAPRK